MTNLHEDKILIISILCPGNYYPVIEAPNDKDSLLGSPIKIGYQVNN